MAHRDGTGTSGPDGTGGTGGIDGTGGWPLGRVTVRGTSMLPTLAPGDCLVVRWRARVRPGDVVVVRLPNRPLAVKRVVRGVANGWWVEGDNGAASTDSRTIGPLATDAVLGRVVVRYWPLPVRRVS